jgi:hypothetical protein
LPAKGRCPDEAIALDFRWKSQGFLKPLQVMKHRQQFPVEAAMAGLNKKREARKSVQQSGWITLDGGFAARTCVVHDLSSTGAKITMEDSSALAGRLRLAFSRDARRGRKCEVVWRRGKSLGVKFVK